MTMWFGDLEQFGGASDIKDEIVVDDAELCEMKLASDGEYGGVGGQLGGVMVIIGGVAIGFWDLVLGLRLVLNSIDRVETTEV